MNPFAAKSDFRGLVWTGGESASLGQMLAAGAVVWGVYSLVQLAAQGVVLDEAVMPAQIIAGAVVYPPGHPHVVFYSQAFSLPNFACALLWKLMPSAVVISSLRNLVFVFVSVFMPFACALVLTRRPMWGHLAAALTLTEAGLRIQGLYPTWVFPDFYSHGHIGLETATITAILLLAQCWRTGGFLLGLMPAIHATMALVLWPWAFLWLLAARWNPEGRERRQLVAGFCSGIAICAALGLFIYLHPRPASPVSPYDLVADGTVILRNFTAFSDYHRRLFAFLHLGYFANFVAFFAFGLLLWSGNSQRTGKNHPNAQQSVAAGLMLFGGVAWIWVYGARFAHLALGHFPAILEQVMPNRFSDIASVLLVPLTAALLGTALDSLPDKLRAGAFGCMALFLAGVGIAQGMEGLAFAWLYPGLVSKVLIFFLWGLVFAMDFMAHRGNARRTNLSLAVFVALGASIAAAPGTSRSVILTLVAGFFLTAAIVAIVQWISRPPAEERLSGGFPRGPALVAALLLLALASLSPYRRDLGRWTRLSAADRELKAWLDHNASPSDLVLSPLAPRSEIQTKTNHPVLMEPETFYAITYMPRLTGLVGTMGRELYGIDYADERKLRSLVSDGRVHLDEVWVEPWEKRPVSEWEELGRKYHFRFVLSTKDVPLTIPQAFHAGDWVLYEIPGSTTSEASPSHALYDAGARHVVPLRVSRMLNGHNQLSGSLLEPVNGLIVPKSPCCSSPIPAVKRS